MVSWPCLTNDLVESSARSSGVSAPASLRTSSSAAMNDRSCVGDRCVPREKFFPVDRLAAIDPLEVVAQRGLNPRIFRFRRLRLIGQRPTPNVGLYRRPSGGANHCPQNKPGLAADRRDFGEEFPDFKKDSVSALRSRSGGGCRKWFDLRRRFPGVLPAQAARGPIPPKRMAIWRPQSVRRIV